MASTEMVKPDAYRALQPDARTLEIVRENLRGEEISEFDLARVRMPAGGATNWEIPVLGGTEGSKAIEGLLVFSKFTRSYWILSYDELRGKDPPDCSSPDATLATA